jgi:predicted nucleotide-binding protein (sugar kinase/HSP70/actin superfamily)
LAWFSFIRKKRIRGPLTRRGEVIGIPRGMMFYHFFPLWKSFWENLGWRVEVSPITTTEIVEAGKSLTRSDLCLPVKTFLGHVLWLQGRVDALFLPRLISFEEGAYLCPKILGLNDMIRNLIPDLPAFLEPMVNYKGPRKITLESAFLSLAESVGLPEVAVAAAFREAQIYWEKEKEDLYRQRGIPQGLISEDLARALGRVETASARFHLGIIGRPYLLFDPVLSHQLLKRLALRSCEMTCIQGIRDSERERQEERLSKKVYWSLGRDLVAASLSFSQREEIDGLISVSSFACGQDAFTSYLVDHYARQHSAKPFLSLVLDEHSSEVGLQTRLEAFFDLLGPSA